jgi:hypothetical protein
MRRLSLRVVIALITFIIGVAAVSVWPVGRRPFLSPIPTETNSASTARSDPASITQDRDLSLYDFGGRRGCGSLLISDIPRCEADRKKARAFIWKHWQEKRRGYIIFQFVFDDGGSDAHIFIEPNEAGAWHVAWRNQAFVVGHSGEINEQPDTRSIERRRAGKDDDEPAGTVVLVFRDDDGKEIRAF